jgi:hypothetical protein
MVFYPHHSICHHRCRSIFLFWTCFGISSILNLIILVPIYTIMHFKVKERLQGILLSAGVIILLTFFACSTMQY